VDSGRAGGRRPTDARELRPKNAYNLLRLIQLATGWLRFGAPTFEASGAFRGRLLAIKRGEVALDEVLREAEALSPALEAARDESRLPEHPDYRAADALLKRLGQELARRHVSSVPGPFGAQAPEAPVPVNPEEEASGLRKSPKCRANTRSRWPRGRWFVLTVGYCFFSRPKMVCGTSGAGRTLRTHGAYPS
jgi:hypothetical protein